MLGEGEKDKAMWLKGGFKVYFTTQYKNFRNEKYQISSC